jgi:hypothetical protein
MGRIPYHHDHQQHSGQAERAKEGQAHGQPVAPQRGQADRRHRDAERLGALPDAHRQPALRCGEPAEDQPPARRVHRTARGAGGGQARPERDHAAGMRGGEQHHAGAGQAAGQDQALTEPVRRRAPGDQGEQQARGGAGDQEPGLFQGQAVRPQRRDEVGQPVLERAAGGQRDRPRREDQPPPHSAHIHILILMVRYMRQRDPVRGVSEAMGIAGRRSACASTVRPGRTAGP